MIVQEIDEAQWAIRRMQDHISYTGWCLSIIAGILLWSMLIRAIL